jgi:hypothetical protein
MKLTQNFSLREAEKSQTALRNEIDNSVPDIIIPAVQNVASKILQPIREHFGISIQPSSWFRCLELERNICAKKIERVRQADGEAGVDAYLARKQHPKGCAVDFEVPGIPNIEVAKWAAKNCDFDQIILEFFSTEDPAAGWVHASSDPSGSNRRQILTFDGRRYSNGFPE